MMPISDFTGGQASTYRIHHLEFANDTRLEKNMEPLFFLDSRLKESTERHFPTLGSPFFVDLELRLGRSPRNEMNQVDTGRHSGLASSSNPHRDLALGLPSSSSLTTSDCAGRPPDGEQHDNRNTEQLAKMKSNEPHTNRVDDPDSHYGPTGAELVSNPHQD
ncbi:uncharacterized protein LOC125315578 [Rhodamnia argentea]|uniref:Uncharacterized protein LOC125315578 n=1 Tax=Rhodamnia argentea TaxID=178133 RepID=A0ABM3HJR3_9MYRT|nr:uncharacterized protein LOC125315578 [Rhodamnia argentea]